MSKYRDKIEALLRQAADPAATEAESATFYAKAQDLMLKHGIDEKELQPGEEPQRIDKDTVTLKGYFSKARMSLLIRIARSMSCTTFYMDGAGSTLHVTVVGYERDVESVLLLFSSLDAQAATDLKKFQKNDELYQMSDGKERFLMRRSFLYAFSARVGARLMENREQATDDKTGNSLLPVLKSKAERVEEYVDETYQLRKARSARIHGSAVGSAAGTAAGSRANLGGTGVGGSTKGALGR